MKEFHSLLREISEITSNIETNYPELYRYLDENPTTIATSKNPKVDEMAMQEYLESLKQLLKHHQETHTKKL